MVKKACSTCKESKPRLEFYPSGRTKDGLNGECSDCCRERNRRYMRRVYATEEGRKRLGGAVRRYQSTARGKESLRRSQARYLERHPGVKAAHSAVHRAIVRGDLVRPSKCPRCGSVGPVQGHHADYSKQLEVEWLCRRCHRREHLG